MTKLAHAFAILPFLSAVALAQPATPSNNDAQPRQAVQLSDNQMDKINAGWDQKQVIPSNTSVTWIAVYETPFACGVSCYININSMALSISSQIGP